MESDSEQSRNTIIHRVPESKSRFPRYVTIAPASQSDNDDDNLYVTDRICTRDSGYHDDGANRFRLSASASASASLSRRGRIKKYRTIMQATRRRDRGSCERG